VRGPRVDLRVHQAAPPPAPRPSSTATGAHQGRPDPSSSGVVNGVGPAAVASAGGLTSVEGAAPALGDAAADRDAEADAFTDGLADALAFAEAGGVALLGAVVAPAVGFFVGLLVPGFFVCVGLGLGCVVVRFAGAMPG
jgi:hypothetical protein